MSVVFPLAALVTTLGAVAATLFAILLALAPFVMILIALKLLRRRERNTPPPPVLDEFDADVACMQQRVANLEEILLNASRVR